MAFNWPTFWTRAFTALIFVAVIAAGFLYNEWSFFILIAIIHFGGWYEYIQLTEKIHRTSLHPLFISGLMLLGFHILLFFTRLPLMGYTVSGSFSLPFLIAGMVLIVIGLFQQKSIHLKSVGSACLGLLYISLSLGLFLQMRLSDYAIIKTGEELWEQGNGFYLPVIIILAIWINDTMAYLVGSAIGKTPFSKISPKKTLEGTLGGMLLCVGAVTLILKPFFHWPVLLGISLIAALFGTVGDLLESKIKRLAGVKDSGHIMPGHGGFLDRFDSLLITVPVVWLFLNIIARFPVY